MSTLNGVSILVTSFNTPGHFLRECEASVYQQNAKTPFEVIFVDDGSAREDTLQALGEMQGPLTRVVRLPLNKGHTTALNTALEAAQFDFVLPLDGDDRLVQGNDGSNYIDRGQEVLSEQQNTVITYARAEFFGERQGIWMLPRYRERTNLVRNNIPVFGMYRREEAQAAGGYNTEVKRIAEWGMWTALVDARFRQGQPRDVVELPDRYYQYRQHQSGAPRLSSKRPPPIETVAVLYKSYPTIYQHHFAEQLAGGDVTQLEPLTERGLMDTLERMTRYGREGLHTNNLLNMANLGRRAARQTINRVMDHFERE